MRDVVSGNVFERAVDAKRVFAFRPGGRERKVHTLSFPRARGAGDARAERVVDGHEACGERVVERLAERDAESATASTGRRRR